MVFAASSELPFHSRADRRCDDCSRANARPPRRFPCEAAGHRAVYQLRLGV